MDDLTTYAENTWCPGCGNFGIFTSFKKAVLELEEKGTPRSSIVFTSGIGQHAKIFDYLNLSSFYSLHGRGTAAAEGIKMANPDLTVVSFGGDGDSFGEGLAHLIFAAKRNMDITVIVHDNGVYGLTTGQFSPLSPTGYKGPSTPSGSVENPFNPLTLMMESGATFVARGFSGKPEHLTGLFVRAIKHKGFSFVDVLQPCVTFLNTWEEYTEKTVIMETEPEHYEQAIAAAKKTDTLALGVFLETEKPVFHDSLYNGWNPATRKQSRDERLKNLKEIICFER